MDSLIDIWIDNNGGLKFKDRQAGRWTHQINSYADGAYRYMDTLAER
jgi:hypothetical protein